MFRAVSDTQWALSEQRNGGRVAEWGVGGHPADWCCVRSHFHLDHCGALPYFSEMVGYDGPIYMTQPTQAICPILLEDYRKIAVDKKGEANFFTSQMIKDCMKKVVAVHLHQTVQVSPPLPAPNSLCCHPRDPWRQKVSVGPSSDPALSRAPATPWLCLSAWKRPKRATVPSEYIGAGRVGQRPECGLTATD